MNYCDFLFEAKPEWLEMTALVDAADERRYTYRELQEQVRAGGNGLRRMGFKHGDVITTHLYNGAEAVIAHLSIQFAGCVTCLLDPLIMPDGLRYFLEDTQTRCLMTHMPAERLSTALPEAVRVLGVEDINCIARTERDGDFQENPFPFEKDELAAIFYTSGTTSRPKGVMLPPRTFFSHHRIFTRACYTYEPEDNLVCFVPFSHGYGSKSIFLPCLAAGATMVTLRSFHPLRVVELIEKEKITHIFGVPSHYQQLLRREEFVEPLRKLKAAFSAAALLKVETATEWKEKIGFHLDEGYGLNETCTGVAFRRGRLMTKLGHMGTYPKDLVEIGIVDDDFRFLQPEERGELVIKGESVMLGYLNKPEETERSLKEGWFRTGDMGYKTADDEIVLTGRIKDVINVAGIKVAPFEIEAVLNEHEDVSESAVLGVEDEVYGEVVKAFVKPEAGVEQDERKLVVYLQKKLMNFQVPKSIVFVKEFPRNTMGKIDKKALRIS
ncbi:MAG: class I adenylate-forming enzyme family protein [Bacteroidota bacterium]